MSADCCDKPYDLGCFACSSLQVELPFDAPSTGDYTAKFVYQTRIIEFEFTGVAEQPLVVPFSGLNENGTHRFYIVNSDDERLDFESGGTTYDCLRFKTSSTITGDDNRKHPRDFTCGELLDDTYGLTDAQLGVDCLDCSGAVTQLIDFHLYVGTNKVGEVTNVDPSTEPTIQICT